LVLALLALLVLFGVTRAAAGGGWWVLRLAPGPARGARAGLFGPPGV